MKNFCQNQKKLTQLPQVFGISFDEEPLFYMPYLMGFGIDYVPDFNDQKVKNVIQNYAWICGTNIILHH